MNRGLESITDCKVVSVAFNAAELALHSPRAEHALVVYPKPREITTTTLSLWEELQVLDHIGAFLGANDVDDIDRRYIHTRDSVGMHAAEYYVLKILQGRIKLYLENELPVGVSSLAGILKPPPAPRVPITFIPALQTILERHSTKFDRSTPVHPRRISPKVRSLVDILNNHQKEGLQCIVFVQQRQVATTLAWLLPQLPELDWVSANHLIGQLGKDIQSRGIAVAGQKKVVTDFREGKFNILVASSVAEEGLDFQSLSLVIRFDRKTKILSRCFRVI